jgi:alkylhydroperoxidase family enzyme
MSDAPSPRLAPLAPSEWNDELRQMFATIEEANGEVFNIFKTLGRYPKLLKRWLVFANHCLVKSSLPPRERELVILRAGWLSKSEYEWAQHNRIAREEGLSADEIERVKEGGNAAGWTPAETALLNAVDELLADKTLSDAG